MTIEGCTVNFTVPFEFCSFYLLRYHSLSVHLFLQVWDTKGSERLEGLLPIYFRDAQAVLLVYDITNRVSDIHPSVSCAPPFIEYSAGIVQKNPLFCERNS